MNIAIVGYATEGTASAQYFLSRGHEVTICDKNADTKVSGEFTTQLGDQYLHNLDRFDIIVRSAGIHPKVILAENPAVANKITTAVNEFLEQSPTKNIIGITGTKGKGTTSTLTANILKSHGETVWLGGNIGLSPLEFIDKITPDDWVVLELSSFQLYDVKLSPHIAACLMIAPEHLDWHSDVEDYYSAKSNLFRQQKSDDVAIYYAADAESKTIAENSAGVLIPYYGDPGAKVCEHEQIEIEGNVKLCHTDELRLIGKHNWQNVCAAITIAWQANCKDIAKIKEAVTSFSGLPHRLELVREFNSVRYYDDSFGTTPETAIVAIQAFDEPKILILGGSDKGSSFKALARAVTSGSVQHAIVIGDTATVIAADLKEAGFTAITLGLTSMDEIVESAHAKARPGDVVLLSAGCASFGLFKNYKDRGEQFVTAVQSLA